MIVIKYEKIEKKGEEKEDQEGKKKKKKKKTKKCIFPTRGGTKKAIKQKGVPKFMYWR